MHTSTRRCDDPDAKEQFQRVADAFFTLSDKDRRAQYDKSLAGKAKYSQKHTDPFKVFGSIFDDLMSPEVPQPNTFWQPLGTVAGSILGFIFANIPGAVIGGVAGNQMGKIRDVKGVSVYEAFTKLSLEKRRKVLQDIATKLLTSAIH